MLHRRAVPFAFLLFVALPCLAQPETAARTTSFLYDAFQDKLIDPARWTPGRFICGSNTL